jgi:hypothetical protein
MYTVITTFDRPSTDVPYYLDTDPLLKENFNGFLTLYKDLYINLRVENTDLKQLTFITYENEDMCNRFVDIINDSFPTLFTDRDAYCEANQIIVNRYTQIHD